MIEQLTYLDLLAYRQHIEVMKEFEVTRLLEGEVTLFDYVTMAECTKGD